MIVILRVGLLALCAAGLLPSTAQAGGGVVFEQTETVSYADPGARESLARLDALGAEVVAVVPFVWQRTPESVDPVPGGSVSADQLRAGIVAAKRAGLTAVVKPHVWVPGTWAGAVDPGGPDAWAAWFEAYADALEPYVRAAREGGADVFLVGTELRRSLGYVEEWRRVVRRVRAGFDGRVGYVAHGLDDFDRVGFADDLDIVAATLYPPMAEDPHATISRLARGLAARAEGLDARVWAAEIGLRSAEGSLPRPWESPAERAAAPDPLLQASILGRWLSELDRPEIEATLIYRWFTDPDAGGPDDTDFTPQNKPAEGVLLCAWTDACGGR